MNLASPSQARPPELSTSHHAELVVRVIESAPAVHRRYQFFVWAQSYLQMLLPHDLSVCAAYHRTQKELVFETFHSVPLAPDMLAVLANGQSGVMREVLRQWVERAGGCVVVDVSVMRPRVAPLEIAPLLKGGFNELIVHGVSRPQRPRELESLFVLAAAGQHWSAQHRSYLELVLPHLHATYVRVQSNERELGAPTQEPAPPQATERRSSPVTARECQILRWVREGKTNAEIAVALEISPLTVKNHVQKILRKMDAANRAQAVAMAIQQNLL
jgi:transcriptional regulator EpsA